MRSQESAVITCNGLIRWAKSRWASRHAARYITGGPGLRSLWKRKKKWHTAVDQDVIELFLLSALAPWGSVSEPVCLFKSRTKIDQDETALQGRGLVHFVGWPTSPLRRQWRSTRHACLRRWAAVWQGKINPMLGAPFLWESSSVPPQTLDGYDLIRRWAMAGRRPKEEACAKIFPARKRCLRGAGQTRNRLQNLQYRGKDQKRPLVQVLRWLPSSTMWQKCENRSTVLRSSTTAASRVRQKK